MSTPRASGLAAIPGKARERGAGHRLWMFDFDNTLAPLEPAVDWAAGRRELQAWLAAAGIAPALFEEIPRGNLLLYEALRARLAAGGEPAHATWPEAARAAFAREARGGAAAALLDGACAIIERYELAGVDAVSPAPGALELLGALRAAGAAIAIVTSNSSRTVAAWMRARGAAGLVDRIVGRDSRLALKPSPATLERALADARLEPSQAAFVGDSESDLRAAAAARVRFYGVNARPQGRERLVALGASPVFASPAEMSLHLGLAPRNAAD